MLLLFFEEVSVCASNGDFILVLFLLSCDSVISITQVCDCFDSEVCSFGVCFYMYPVYTSIQVQNDVAILALII